MASASTPLARMNMRRKTSVTAGTIFHRIRTPLSTWFAAIWFVTATHNGVSAANLQQIMGFGSYETAWAWLHKLRRAMVRPDRDQLNGVVEVDETWVGGRSRGPGKDGGGTDKTIVMVAVERRGNTALAVCGWPRFPVPTRNISSASSIVAWPRDPLCTPMACHLPPPCRRRLCAQAHQHQRLLGTGSRGTARRPPRGLPAQTLDRGNPAPWQRFRSSLHDLVGVDTALANTSRMVERLGAVIQSRSAVLATATQEVRERQDRLLTVFFALVSILAIPPTLVLAFFGVSSNDVDSRLSLFDVHRYWPAYVLAWVPFTTLLVVGLLLRRRVRARGSQLTGFS